jgi:hypothetical protein
MATTERPLTPRQERFAQLVAHGKKSQADAYREAYPTSCQWKDASVYVAASELAADAKVSRRIQELKVITHENVGLQAEKVLMEVKMLAHSDIGSVMHPDGRVKLPNELDPATRAAVKKFRIDELGRIEYARQGHEAPGPVRARQPPADRWPDCAARPAHGVRRPPERRRCAARRRQRHRHGGLTVGNTRKPRKAYRPRLIEPDPVSLAIARASLVPQEGKAAMLQRLQAALEGLRTANGGWPAWCDMADAMNVAEQLALAGIASDRLLEIEDAQASLSALHERHGHTGSWTLYPRELHALDEGAFFLRTQLAHCTQGELDGAIKRVERRMSQALAGNGTPGGRKYVGRLGNPTTT